MKYPRLSRGILIEMECCVCYNQGSSNKAQEIPIKAFLFLIGIEPRKDRLLLHTVRYAVIGTSWITEKFIEGASLVQNMKLAGVYSRTRERAEAFIKDSKVGDSSGISIFTDLKDMATSSTIDAVYIASPNRLHYEQSKLFLQHGKHVLCEKPITVNASQLRELMDLAQQRGLIYMEAIMMRHLPARAVLHEAVSRIGHITTARLDFSQLSSKYPALQRGELPNIFNPCMATGGLMDLGIYPLYLALDLFGKPKTLAASAGLLSTGADGFGCCILNYEDKQVVITYSKTGQSHIGSEILGDQGTIIMESSSKLIEIYLMTTNENSEIRKEKLVGTFEKETLMSGEAAAFYRYITNPEQTAKERSEVSALTLLVSETMEEIRRLAGIRFSGID